MYILFREHHVTPGQYAAMGYGERTVLKAFVRYQMEKEAEMIQRANDKD